MIKRRYLIAAVAVLGCGSESPGRAGPPVVVVRLMLEPSVARAVHLQVSGPGTNAFTSGGTGLLVESTILSDRIAIAAFGDPLAGEVGVLSGVAPIDAGLVQPIVVEAVGADNLPLPAGAVIARVVVDTVQ